MCINSYRNDIPVDPRDRVQEKDGDGGRDEGPHPHQKSTTPRAELIGRHGHTPAMANPVVAPGNDDHAAGLRGGGAGLTDKLCKIGMISIEVGKWGSDPWAVSHTKRSSDSST